MTVSDATATDSIPGSSRILLHYLKLNEKNPNTVKCPLFRPPSFVQGRVGFLRARPVWIRIPSCKAGLDSFVQGRVGFLRARPGWNVSSACWLVNVIDYAENNCRWLVYRWYPIVPI
jgi:hypothetical protein